MRNELTNAGKKLLYKQLLQGKKSIQFDRVTIIYEFNCVRIRLNKGHEELWESQSFVVGDQPKWELQLYANGQFPVDVTLL